MIDDVVSLNAVDAALVKQQMEGRGRSNESSTMLFTEPEQSSYRASCGNGRSAAAEPTKTLSNALSQLNDKTRVPRLNRHADEKENFCQIGPGQVPVETQPPQPSSSSAGGASHLQTTERIFKNDHPVLTLKCKNNIISDPTLHIVASQSQQGKQLVAKNHRHHLSACTIVAPEDPAVHFDQISALSEVPSITSHQVSRSRQDNEDARST